MFHKSFGFGFAVKSLDPNISNANISHFPVATQTIMHICTYIDEQTRKSECTGKAREDMVLILLSGNKSWIGKTGSTDARNYSLI